MNHRLVAVASLVALFLPQPLSAGSSKKAQPEKETSTQSDHAEDDKRLEVCRGKLFQAQKLDVLYDLDWKLPKEPRVVAGPTFFSMPIDAKEGFVDTVNCFLTAGQAGKCVNFDVLHWQTGKAIGRFSYCKFKRK